MKFILPIKKLYQEPQPGETPPWWIRGLLILTCTGVSFAHGSNDGQKGMGLIMLILIGAAPTAYALNRTMPDSAAPAFIATAEKAQAVFAAMAGPAPVRLAPRPPARTSARRCAPARSRRPRSTPPWRCCRATSPPR